MGSSILNCLFLAPDIFVIVVGSNTPFVDEETGLIIGNSIDVLPVAIPGIHNNDLPLNLSIVEFP